MHCEIFIVTLDTDRMRQLLHFVKCSYFRDTDRMRQLLHFVKCSYFRVRYFAAILCIAAN